jgi:tripartite-type tricarboxylate transporter receptor subunit TctC
MPQIAGHTVKALAILSKKRSASLPDLPSAHEQGLTDLDLPSWYALFLPKGTPDAIVHRLSSAASAALDTPAVRARIEGLGINMVPPQERTPEFLAAFLPAEIKKWAAPIKASGVSID